MLADTEAALIDFIKAQPLAAKLRLVDTLPDLDGDNLVKRFGADAPAVYVSMASFPVSGDIATLHVGIACVARNARGLDAARRGDGMLIGLYEMLDAVLGLFNGVVVGDAGWNVTGVDLSDDDTLYRNGLYAGAVQIQAQATLPASVDPSSLAAFETFHDYVDAPSHDTDAEHQKWLEEPSDQTTSKPDAEDNVTLTQ